MTKKALGSLKSHRTEAARTPSLLEGEVFQRLRNKLCLVKLLKFYVFIVATNIYYFGYTREK